MKSVGMLVAVGLATLAIFSCGVPPAPPPPAVAPTPTPVEIVLTPEPEPVPQAKTLRVWNQEKAMEILRAEAARNPGVSYELVPLKLMSRAGPEYRLIAKKKAAPAAETAR